MPLRFGHITEIDPAKCYARVTFLDDGIVSAWLQIVVMGALRNKHFHMFDINEQVACLMDDDSVEGVILGAVFNDGTNPDGGNKDIEKVTFPDGSYVEYNRASHEYNINVKGKINIISEGETTVQAQSVTVEAEEVTVDATAASIDAESVDIQASVINMTGTANITGTLVVTGALTAASLTAASGSISGGGMSASGGNMSVTGEISGSSVVANGIQLETHTHSGVQTGGGTSGPPTP